MPMKRGQNRKYFSKFLCSVQFAIKRFLKRKGSGIILYEGDIGERCQNTNKQKSLQLTEQVS